MFPGSFQSSFAPGGIFELCRRQRIRSERFSGLGLKLWSSRQLGVLIFGLFVFLSPSFLLLFIPFSPFQLNCALLSWQEGNLWLCSNILSSSLLAFIAAAQLLFICLKEEGDAFKICTSLMFMCGTSCREKEWLWAANWSFTSIYSGRDNKDSNFRSRYWN